MRKYSIFLNIKAFEQHPATAIRIFLSRNLHWHSKGGSHVGKSKSGSNTFKNRNFLYQLRKVGRTITISIQAVLCLPAS